MGNYYKAFSEYLLRVCLFQLDPAVYVDTCLYLYCSLPAKLRESAVCDTLANYARECAQQHVIISWRTAFLCGKEIQIHAIILALKMMRFPRTSTITLQHCMQFKVYNILFCLRRSHLSQGSSIFRLCILLPPQLCISTTPWACCSPGTVQTGVCGGL